jgi:hypothetical protein
LTTGGETGNQNGNGTGTGTEFGNNTTADSGTGTSTEQEAGPEPTCATVSSTATTTKRPVDIIFVIDNSGSMTNEILAVQNNINVNFATIIGNSGLDYRVIMVSRYGAYTSQRICVTAPLSGNTTCSPVPTTNVNGTRFFQYSTAIGSNDSLNKIISTYPSWSGWLRANALKVFVEITDDENTLMTSATFETQLFALTPKMFGDATKRDYVFHTIGGFSNNSPVTAPWLPTDPVQTGRCTDTTVTPASVSPASSNQFQNLSILTGGLRFPICQHQSFDVVFQKIADGVVEGSQVACEYAVPTPPVGKELAKTVVEYTPGGGGAKQQFQKVATVGDCAASKFYVENNTIKLCPATCSVVSADASANVQVLFTCDFSIN